MSPSPEQDDTPGISASSSSCFDIAWHVWPLCVLHVVLVFSSVAVAAAVVVLLPVACMVASLCLVCAITAQLLSPTSFGQPDQVAECGGGASVSGGSRAAGSDDDGSSREEEDEPGREAVPELTGQQECATACVDGYQFSAPRGDEHEQFFWVDAGSYYCYKKFYHLLAFWRRKERAGRR